MRSLRLYGKYDSSKMMIEITDHSTFLCVIGNVCFIRSCTVKEGDIKGTSLSCWENSEFASVYLKTTETQVGKRQKIKTAWITLTLIAVLILNGLISEFLAAWKGVRWWLVRNWVAPPPQGCASFEDIEAVVGILTCIIVSARWLSILLQLDQSETQQEWHTWNMLWPSVTSECCHGC